MSQIDKEYTSVLENVLENGVEKGDRTDTGTKSLFGSRIRLDVSEGSFPIITKKHVIFSSIVSELKWFLRGETHIKPLVDDGVSIWTPNAYDAYISNMADMSRQMLNEIHDRENVINMDDDEVLEVAAEDYGYSPLSKSEYEDTIGGRDQRGALGNELGPIYGKMWRSWPVVGGGKSVDQIQRVVDSLRENPDSRRHIVSSWNPQYHGPVEHEEAALSPCHVLFQFWSKPMEEGKRELHLQMYQRSADMFLGVPFNLTSYSLLLVLMSKATGHAPGEFIWVGGDTHIYQNHMDQVEEFIDLPAYDSPTLDIDFESLEEFEVELDNYRCGPFLKAPVAT